MTDRQTQTRFESYSNQQFQKNFLELLGIVRDSIDFWPPFYFSSILGKPLSWLPLHTYSEYSLLSPWKPLRALRYIADTALPSLPVKPPPLSPPLVKSFFFRPTIIDRRPDHEGDFTSFPDEAWFFINGIMTNPDVAQINAAYLADLFHRPITIIQNTTQGVLIDLKECAFDKEWKTGWGDIQEASRKAFPPIFSALKRTDKKRVVVITHSQGTIITSVVLNMLRALTSNSQAFGAEGAPATIGAQFPPVELAAPTGEPVFIFPYEGMLEPDDFEPLSIDELSKLEIFCFANCANKMTWYSPHGNAGRPVPWIENFANEYDVVARLGMLAPNQEGNGILIDGPIYMRPNAWGHLLNEHYLKPIDKTQRLRLRKGPQGRDRLAPYRLLNAEVFNASSAPRLFTYINGGSPES